MAQIKLGMAVETPDGQGDVIGVNDDTVDVSLNQGNPENCVEKTARASGLYQKSDCEIKD
jgi:hypothetical protein